MAEQICTSSHTSIPTEEYLELKCLKDSVAQLRRKTDTTILDTFCRLMVERSDPYDKVDRFTKEGMHLAVDAQQAKVELEKSRDAAEHLAAVLVKLSGNWDSSDLSIPSLAVGRIIAERDTAIRDRDIWRDDCKELDVIRALVNQYDRKPQSITSLAGGIDWMRAQIDLAQIEIENLKFQLKEAQCGCEADAVARQTSAHIVEAIDQIGIRNEFKAGIALGKALAELEKLEG